MNEDFELGRRGFVQTILIAATVAVGRANGLLAEATARSFEGMGRAGRLADCVQEGRSARAVGQTYLATGPSRASLEELTEHLWPSEIDQRGTSHTWELRRAVLERCRADFAAGRTVSVDGWVLSETEARLCALVARLASSA